VTESLGWGMLEAGGLSPFSMPKISALIHTHNDAARIGRTLDSLRPCDDVLVIDSASDDDTAKIAREHGATVKSAIAGVEPGAYAIDTRHEWVLCLNPGEALSEGLEASLHEWQDTEPDEAAPGYSLAVRENARGKWKTGPPEMRLVNRNRVNWTGEVPPNADSAIRLEGELLKFRD
jgi:glycosyltransferase involved in cell wall biosynthesis